jgi:hypothetical protein
VAQVAIVVILLTGSGLLVKSPIKLQEVPLGFSATTLSMKIDLPKSYSKPEQRESFYRTLLSQLSALPGTLTAGAKRQKLLNFHYAEDVRYRERTTLKRVNARLKDEFCGRSVRVRGNAKVILCSASFGWPQIRF